MSAEAVDFSLIFPVYNQESHIGPVCLSYIRAVEPYFHSFELIPAVNACSDNSWAVLQEISKSDLRIRGICIDQKGWGNAVIRGIRAARGHLLMYTNAARTTASDIVDVLNASTPGQPILTKMSRTLRDSRLRWLGSSIYNFESRLLWGIRCRDINGTPKMFPRKLLEGIELREKGDLLDLELMIYMTKKNVPIIDVPKNFWKRAGGRSTTNIRSAIQMYFGALRLRVHLSK
ncbi:glycosyltransferase [Candidatus Parcubacteria bacterium]|nr:MAG: glycosyltransferase [Candidatus Parcubacteria bacterium]